jgi:polyisoprenoid-binding protein YceI
MQHVRRLSLGLLLAMAGGLLASSAGAHPTLKGRTYHFGTHPARTNVTFVSETDLETIHGISHAIRGNATIDAAGTSAHGSLRIGVGALRTGIDLRDEHMRSAAWLDAARYPWIKLDLVEATETEDPHVWAYVGRLTIKGVTKALRGEARISVIPDRLGKVLGNGSWLRVRTKFQVRITDFGIVIPERVGPRVSEVWDVTVDVYGTTAEPRGWRAGRGRSPGACQGWAPRSRSRWPCSCGPWPGGWRRGPSASN